MSNIKERLAKIGKTQRWLILELQKFGIQVASNEMCRWLKGVDIGPKGKAALSKGEEILNEYEKSQDKCNKNLTA